MKIALLKIFNSDFEYYIPLTVAPADWFDIKKDDFPIWEKYVQIFNTENYRNSVRLILITEHTKDEINQGVCKDIFERARKEAEYEKKAKAEIAAKKAIADKKKAEKKKEKELALFEELKKKFVEDQHQR